MRAKAQGAPIYPTQCGPNCLLLLGGVQVDKRFKLDKALGTAPLSTDDAVTRLNRLFLSAEDVDVTGNPDVASSSTVMDLDSPVGEERSGSGEGSRSAGTESPSPSRSPAQLKKGALRKYIEGFDQAAMVEVARIVSQEGAALVERQTSAVLGDIKDLSVQMQDAIGTEVESAEELMQRVASAIEKEKVETVTMTQTVQRRAVLEAVAYGSFLRDVETWVQTDYQLLTPAPLPPAGGR